MALVKKTVYTSEDREPPHLLHWKFVKWYQFAGYIVKRIKYLNAFQLGPHCFQKAISR